ncbi:hypothetical protein RRG08_010815 [Elysia crispata]|uniref:Uncharacterized protein n=1 Tax=Elysia crispata TaxID=231223 RepID=A0AAE0ZFB7_9GAST|nr:hypothetical protein RRG08_010815 [Elysia crispata]
MKEFLGTVSRLVTQWVGRRVDMQEVQDSIFTPKPGGGGRVSSNQDSIPGLEAWRIRSLAHKSGFGGRVPSNQYSMPDLENWIWGSGIIQPGFGPWFENLECWSYKIPQVTQGPKTNLRAVVISHIINENALQSLLMPEVRAVPATQGGPDKTSLIPSTARSFNHSVALNLNLGFPRLGNSLLSVCPGLLRSSAELEILQIMQKFAQRVGHMTVGTARKQLR